MDKRPGSSNRLDILELKTDINAYRCFTFILFALSSEIAILFATSDRNLAEPIIAFVISLSFLLLTVFMDKLVYILKLPTNHLIITKNEMIYKKRKKQFVFKTDEVSYKFHPFYEGFETVSLLEIASHDAVHYIPITKKQFRLIEQYLLFAEKYSK